MVRAIKDSGVEWIGDVPESWSVKEIGNIFKERNEKVSDYDYQPLSVTKNGIVLQLENAAKSDNHDNRKKVKEDDFVINSRSDRKMSSGLSDFDGSVSVINLVLYSKKIDPEFTKYVLKNYGFAEEFYRWGTGIVADLWSTRYDRMKKISIPFPDSKGKQRKIADFLDEKTKHIDSIIEKTKQSIEEFNKYREALITETVTKGLNTNVKMKDSEVEWIGEIPEYWNTEKLKYIVKLRNQKSIYEIGNKYVGLENIEGFNGKLNSVNEDYQEGLTDLFKEGDILFSKLRPYLTKGFVAQFDGFCSGELLIFKQFKGHKIFLLYFLLSSGFIEAVNSSTYGTKMPRANWDFIKELLIPVPDFLEQQQIADYLDEKTTHIDSLIGNKEKMVYQLEEYKKSMIYEYVTGKKEVE